MSGFLWGVSSFCIEVMKFSILLLHNRRQEAALVTCQILRATEAVLC